MWGIYLQGPKVHHRLPGSLIPPEAPHKEVVVSSYGSTALVSNSFQGGLLVLVFSFQLRHRHLGEGSSSLISDLHSSIKYKGGAKTHRQSSPVE